MYKRILDIINNKRDMNTNKILKILGFSTYLENQKCYAQFYLKYDYWADNPHVCTRIWIYSLRFCTESKHFKR